MAEYDGKIKVGIDYEPNKISDLKAEIKAVNKEVETTDTLFDNLFKSFNKSASGSNIGSFATTLISKMHDLSNQAGNLKTALSNVLASNIGSGNYEKEFYALSDSMRATTASAEVFKQTIQSLGNTGVDLSAFEKSFTSEFASIMPKIADSMQLYANKMEIGEGIPFESNLEGISRAFNAGAGGMQPIASRLLTDFNSTLKEQGKSIINLDDLFGSFSSSKVLESDFGDAISAIRNMSKEAGVDFSKLIDINTFNEDVKSIIPKVKELSQATKGVGIDGNTNRESVKKLREEYEKLKSTRDNLSTYKDSVGDITFSAGTAELDASLKRADSGISELEKKFAAVWATDEIKDIINIGKEESKLEKLKKLAEQIKIDFVSKDMGSYAENTMAFHQLAQKVRLEFEYKDSLDKITKQLGTVKKAAEGIKLNFARTGDVEKAQKGVDALKNKINELKAKRDSLNEAYEQGVISEVDFIANTSDIDRTIDELESETVQIEADIKLSKFFNLKGLSGITNQLGSIKNFAGLIGSKFSVVTGVAKTTLSIFKGMLKVADFFNESLKKAVSRMKSFNDTLKDTVTSFVKLTKGVFDFMHDMTSVLPIANKLKESLSNIGFGDLVGADLLANAIREATNAVKEFGKSSINEGSNFQSAYLRIKDTFGDARDEIYKFAKTAKDNLGMSETQYLLAAGKIGVFARSYISDTKELAKVTNALSLSIADLSAQTGFSIDETMQKVLSGLRGNTEAIEELGVNVKVKDMQTWLDNQGINAKFADLDSNMQNLYRTWYMLDKVATNGAMGYAAKMMNTYSGQVRILQANLSSLKTTIGTYLMQAITPVLQVINMILGKLIDLANMIGKVFGLKDRYSLADSIGAVDTSGFEDVYNGGKEAIKGAVDEQNKLTDATNNTTKATNKAAEAAKKALAPFHKLNVLSNNKDSGSGAGSGAGGGVPSGVGVGSSIKVGKIDTKGANEVVSAWLEALKEAIKNGEWYAVGVLLAAKANEVVKAVKKVLEKVQPFLKKWAKNIADIINGFVSEFDWTNLGSTVATGINTITSTILEFTKNVNWDKLGVGFSKFFRGLLRDTDWKAVGEFWTEKTRILIGILSGFVKDMSEINPDTGLTGWQELGISLYKIIDGMINNIPWGTLGLTIAGALNGISDAIIKFVDRFDAADAVSKIVSGINTAILEFDATKFTNAASGLINELFEALKTAVTEMNWFSLGSTIGEAIFGTLANINWDDVAETIEGALNAVLDFAGMFVVALNKNQDKIKEGITKVFDNIVSWLSNEENQKAILETINGLINSIYGILVDQDWSGLYNALYSIFSGIEWSKLLTVLNFPDIISKAIGGESVLAAARQALLGLLEGIASFILNTGNPLALGWNLGSNIIEGLIEGITGNPLELPSISDIFFGFIDWIKGIFGVHSPSTVFAEIGGFLIEGLINGISGMWENLKSFFAESIPTFISDVKTKFDGLHENLATTWDNIKTYAGTKWEEIKTSIGTSVDDVKSSVETKWEDIKSNLATTWDTIKSNAGTKWEETKLTISGVVEGLKADTESKWETIKSNLLTTWDNIKINAGSKWEGIKSTISGVVDGVKSDTESKWNTLESNTVSAFEGIKSGIINAFSTVSGFIKSPINSIISLVESMVNKIISGINSAIDTLNKFSIEVPSGVPVIGGQKWGFSLSKLSRISIPRLANGAVIKPNQRFLAELGDQTKGVNIETPLDTMLDAFRGALSEYNGTGDIIIPIYVNDELNSEEIIHRQDIARYRSNGK